MTKSRHAQVAVVFVAIATSVLLLLVLVQDAPSGTMEATVEITSECRNPVLDADGSLWWTYDSLPPVVEAGEPVNGVFEFLGDDGVLTIDADVELRYERAERFVTLACAIE